MRTGGTFVPRLERGDSGISERWVKRLVGKANNVLMTHVICTSRSRILLGEAPSASGAEEMGDEMLLS